MEISGDSEDSRSRGTEEGERYTLPVNQGAKTSIRLPRRVNQRLPKGKRQEELADLSP